MGILDLLRSPSISKSIFFDITEKFNTFVGFATNWKEVLSFGGWDFSTSLDTSIDTKYDLDGVDFDWEYSVSLISREFRQVASKMVWYHVLGSVAPSVPLIIHLYC